MNNKCLICGDEISERSHFWKKHRKKESQYYQEYYNFKDLLTGEQIEFKSPEQYFNTDFKDKNNLKKYLETNSKDKGLKYLTDWLKKRKELKKLQFAPSHFELRTLCYPSIKFIHSFYGADSYENICKEVGLKIRFDYNQKIEQIEIKPKIIKDTREVRGINFENIEVKKLDEGDYAAEFNPFNIFIERKSLADAIGTLGAGFDRFEREVARSEQKGKYLIMLIESKISNFFGFNKLGYIHGDASTDYILKRARDILSKYENFQICCVDGRIKAKEFIEKIYSLKNNPRTIDFQYEIDCKKI